MDEGLSEAFARASGVLEAEDPGAADEGTGPDEEALVACADEAYTCFDEARISPSGCLDTYIACAVASGVPADHEYLVCLGDLSGCWAGVSTSDEADVCYANYDGCVAEATPEPSEPETPSEPVEPGDPNGPIEACAYAADDCLLEVDPADGPAQARCLDSYDECLAAAGVAADEPYLGCLADTRACLSDAASYESAELCWYGFQTCYEDNYGYVEPDPEPEPDNGDEASICEPETIACYEAGGSNAECIGVFQTCLLDSGIPEDHPYMSCLDELIACVGPAEASDDPDAALEVCADTFNRCAETTVPAE
ncbi:MAG TPA: hypothetical protein PK095_05280 [Myxococcota bacterium]|nr:hypothetical protein [Myxococcota bacterium]